MPRVLGDNEPLQDGERKATCTNCLSTFAFKFPSEGVECTNELEYLLDCPSCRTALEIGKGAGVVRQRRFTDDN